jgi:hypothetical protein
MLAIRAGFRIPKTPIGRDTKRLFYGSTGKLTRNLLDSCG